MTEDEFVSDLFAAGNVRRVKRKLPNGPGIFTVFATEFFYNRAAEVQAISQRQWSESQGIVVAGSMTTDRIREFRGGGRARYMTREWLVDPTTQLPLAPDYASTVWTNYDGDIPSIDYQVWWDEGLNLNNATIIKAYDLGLVELDYSGGYTTNYINADQIGTTRTVTDDPATGPTTVNARLVYTAFGEPISTAGPFTTRYQYAGAAGYETFDTLEFQHLGARWYDPATGRFMQRDPIGIRGGPNVYAYVANAPTIAVDPDGLVYRDAAGRFARAPWWRRLLPKLGKGARWSPIGVCGWIAVEITDRIVRPAIDNWAESNYKKKMQELNRPFELPRPPIKQPPYTPPAYCNRGCHAIQ